ncbi:MAG TPA: thermonuclease family protein [Candidatus Paceibacterota bacterium]
MTSKALGAIPYVLVGLVGLGLGFAYGMQGKNEKQQITPYDARLLVDEVTDGDTMFVVLEGKRVKVRLMGVDTPETVDKRKSAQCFGDKASAETKKLQGKTVRVQFIAPDWPPVKRDRYERALVYVYDEKGDLYNEKLIRDGLAREYTFKGPYEHRKRLKDAQADAKAMKRGMWHDPACAIESSREKP